MDSYTKDLPAVMTPEECARLLRIGRTAMYELLRRRDGSGVPHVRVGKLYRIHRDALLAWLQAGNTSMTQTGTEAV